VCIASIPRSIFINVLVKAKSVSIAQGGWDEISVNFLASNFVWLNSKLVFLPRPRTSADPRHEGRRLFCWMSQDDFFYCAPCRLKILVAPLGKVRTSSFSETLRLLRENGSTISLKSLDQERLVRTIFKPNTFPQGQLLFDFITYWDSHYTYLEDFQQWRKLFGVCSFIGGLIDALCRWLRLRTRRMRFRRTNRRNSWRYWEDRYGISVCGNVS